MELFENAMTKCPAAGHGCTPQYYYSVVVASDQTAGHGLEIAKCPAVRNFLLSATKWFLETSKEYQSVRLEMSSDSKN